MSSAEELVQPQVLSEYGAYDHVSPTEMLNEAAVEYEDDDYYDVDPDDQMLDDHGDEEDNTTTTHQDFSLIQRMHRESTNDLDIRRYDAFIYDGMLTHYRPEQVAHPLRNPQTARVFLHFIHVT